MFNTLSFTKTARGLIAVLFAVLMLAVLLLLRFAPASAQHSPASHSPDRLSITSPLSVTSAYTIYIPLVLNNAGPPIISCFTAVPSSVALGHHSSLNWCTTGAISLTLTPGITTSVGFVTGTNTIVTPTSSTHYVLRAFNDFGITQRTTTITVTGGGPCGNIGVVQAWEGTLGFSYGKTGSDSNESISMQHGGNVSFHIEQSSSGPGGVSWIGFGTGNVNIDDKHISYGTPDQVSTLVGSSAPITLVQGIEEHSRVALNIRYSDCTYNFSFDPYVEATETDPSTPPFQIETTVGSIRSDNRALSGGTSGTANFPAHSEVWGYSHTSEAYFPPWPITTGFGPFPNEASLGSASVQWSFSQAP